MSTLSLEAIRDCNKGSFTSEFSAMPEPSAEYKDKIVKYTGESTNMFQNNQNYKCVELNINNVTTYQWINTVVSTSSNFVNARKSIMPVAGAGEVGKTYQYIGKNKDGFKKGFCYTCVKKDKDILYQYIELTPAKPHAEYIDKAYYKCVGTTTRGVTTYSYELFDSTGVDLNNYIVIQRKVMLDPCSLFVNGTDKYIWVNVGLIGGSGGCITPQMFGAVGDGIHDDTEAVQAALDVGGIIYFPAGTYLISLEHSRYKSCCLFSNVHDTTIIGEKNRSILKAANSINSTADFLSVGDASGKHAGDGFSIYNMTFRGTEIYGDPTSGLCLLPIWRIDNTVIKDCVFQNNGYAAIALRGGKNILIEGVRIEACDIGIAQQSWACSDVTIRNCHITGLSSINDFKQLYSEPIGTMCDGSEEWGGLCERWVIENIIVEHKRTKAISINGHGGISNYPDGRVIAKDWIIRNITLRDVLAGVVLSNCENVTVENVTYYDSSNEIKSLTSTSNRRASILQVEYSKNVVARNFTSHIPLLTPMKLMGVSGCLFENFSFSDASGDGLLLTSVDKCTFANIRVNPMLQTFMVRFLKDVTNNYIDIATLPSAAKQIHMFRAKAVGTGEPVVVTGNTFILSNYSENPISPFFTKSYSYDEADTNTFVTRGNSFKNRVSSPESIFGNYIANTCSAVIADATQLDSWKTNGNYKLLEDGHEFDLTLNTSEGYKVKKFSFPTTGNVVPISNEEFDIAPISNFTIISHFKQYGNKWVEMQRLKKYTDGRIEDISRPDLVTRSEMEQYIQETDTIPTASADYVGKSYLYTGNTTATYQKGGIYECQQTSSNTYEWKLTNFPVAVVKDIVANATDFADFKSKIALL